MGTDLFTSSRGPGVIGTFMAIFVLLGFGALYVLVFDKSLQGGEKSIESVISDEAKKLGGLKTQILNSRERIEDARGYRKTEGIIEEETLRLGHLEKHHASLKESAASERQKVASVEASWEDYKQAYRKSERSTAKGEKMDELKTLSGKTYKKVKITDIDAVRMQIRHSAGIKGIPFEELPLNLQDRFQFDPKEKEIRVAKEDVARRKGHTGSLIGDLKISIADLKHQNDQGRKKIESLKSALANARAALPNLQNQRASKVNELSQDQSQRSSRTSTGRGGISRAPQIREDIADIDRKIALATRLIPQRSSDIADEENRLSEREARLKQLEKQLKTLNAKLKETGKSKTES